MPIITRSKTRSGQPSDLVTSPREGIMYHPRKIVRSRQGQAVVTRAARDGSPLTSVLIANGAQQPATVSTCISKRRLTYPKFIVNKTFTTNVTNKKYTIITHSGENISCHTSNLIYLLTCSTCNIQYVEETALALHKRINIHQTAKSGCEYLMKHFRNDCVVSSFSIEILDIFEDDSYVTGRLSPIAREKRIEREDHWTKTLRTKYPYRLNDRARDEDSNKPVGLQLPSIRRGATRTARPRTASVPTANTAEAIFEQIYLIIDK